MNPSVLRILFIDNDEDRCVMMRGLLGQTSYADSPLKWASSFALGLEALRQQCHDVCIIDYDLDDRNGLELLSAARAEGINLPAILMTGLQDRDVEMQAMNAGVPEYLTKADLNASVLERSIRSACQQSRLLQALDREHQLLQLLLDNIPDQVYFKDANNRFILVNKVFAESFRFASPEDAIGRSDTDLFTPEYAEQTRRDEQEILAGCWPLIRKEERECRPDSAARWVETTKLPLRDGRGHITGTCRLSRDITDRRQSEEALRTARSGAEAANEAKREFLAGISHELRTPLNAIVGMTELVLESELTDSQREHLQIVSESGAVLQSIIEQMLDLSRIDAGCLELHPAEFEVREVLGEALRTLGSRAYGKGLQLAWQMDPQIPAWLHGDASRLCEVVESLVGNAVKYTDKGEVVVTVACDQQSDQGLLLRFSVRDTGIGIPPEKRDRVFFPFEQADMSTTRRFGGTGLGLVLAVRIAEVMGGRLWLDSVVGVGTTFYFTAEFGRCRRTATHDPAQHGLSSSRVVIADHNLTSRQFLRDVLQSWGMSVDSVGSGQEAVAILTNAVQEENTFPLLIVDADMPETSGLMLADSIFRSPHLYDIPIVLLTSRHSPEGMHSGYPQNVAAVLLKPVIHSELLRAILYATHRTDQELVSPSTRFTGDPGSTTPPLKVLVAEDGRSNQVLMKGLLSKDGHDFVIVENGERAVEEWQNGTFDVILMDVQMPVLDGLEATRRIREQEKAEGGQKHIYIVAVTARAIKGDRERGLQAGMDYYLTKPLRPGALFNMLADVAAKIRGRQNTTNNNSDSRVAHRCECGD